MHTTNRAHARQDHRSHCQLCLQPHACGKEFPFCFVLVTTITVRDQSIAAAESVTGQLGQGAANENFILSSTLVELSLVLLSQLLLVYLSRVISAVASDHYTHLSWPIRPNMVYGGPLLPCRPYVLSRRFQYSHMTFDDHFRWA